MRPAIFYSMFALLLATNALTGVALLMSGDISRLLQGQSDDDRLAYQDRLTQLRLEVDRLHSRQYAQAGSLNLQLQELAQQQEMLTEQHSYVRALASRAQKLGIDTASVPELSEETDHTLTTSALSTGDGGTPEVGKVIQSISSMMTESRQALAALSEAADDSTDTIVSGLEQIGISPDLPAAAETGVGGPYEPLPENYAERSLVDDANAVATAFDRFTAARNAIALAPIHAPIIGNYRLSSGYGPRKDPFLHKSAFHSGLDMAVPRGTSVRSAGAGTVTYAGRRGGYGNVVEITHSGGLVTRYAHLSRILVKDGAEVSAGMPIARAGSTGRSTGPHLHFEIRRNSGPIDPTPFLRAGDKLARFI